MTAQDHIARIRAALDPFECEYELADACNPAVMTELLAHIDHQQAEIERLKRLTSALHNIETAGFQLVEMNQQLMLEIERLKRGEFICAKCSLRKDSEPTSHDF